MGIVVNKVRVRVPEGVDLAPLHGITAAIRTGELVGIVGDARSGAQTLAHLLTAPLPEGLEATGRIRIDGVNPHAGTVPIDRLAAWVGPQPVLGAKHTLGRQLSDALLSTGFPRKEADHRAGALLRAVGLGSVQGAQAGSLGVLDAHRADLALALASGAKVLVADHFGDESDTYVRAELRALLREAHTYLGLTVLVVTQDLGAVADLAQRVLLLDAGTVVADAPVRSFFASPPVPLARALIAAAPRLTLSDRVTGRAAVAKALRTVRASEAQDAQQVLHRRARERAAAQDAGADEPAELADLADTGEDVVSYDVPLDAEGHVIDLDFVEDGAHAPVPRSYAAQELELEVEAEEEVEQAPEPEPDTWAWDDDSIPLDADVEFDDFDPFGEFGECTEFGAAEFRSERESEDAVPSAAMVDAATALTVAPPLAEPARGGLVARLLGRRGGGLRRVPPTPEPAPEPAGTLHPPATAARPQLPPGPSRPAPDADRGAATDPEDTARTAGPTTAAPEPAEGVDLADTPAPGEQRPPRFGPDDLAPERPARVLEIEDLRIAHKDAWYRTSTDRLSGIDLAVLRGETLGVLGPSRCGSTTLLRAVHGLEEVTRGTITVAGTTALLGPDPAAGDRPGSTVRDLLRGAIRAANPDTHDEDIATRTRRLLSELGMDADIEDAPLQSLGGLARHAVALAEALAANPQVLLLDEPTLFLDTIPARAFHRLVRRAQEIRRLSVLISAHDPALLVGVADRVVVLDRGQIAETGLAKDVLSAPAEPVTERLVLSVPIPNPLLQARRREVRTSVLAEHPVTSSRR